MLYAIMRLSGDDEDDDNTQEYLCHDGAEFYWALHGTERELIHINAKHFTLLARWYWETFKAETPLETWARHYKVDYNQRLIEISYAIDNVVFCGCRLYQRDEGVPLKIYEPRYNHIMGDYEVYEWVQRLRLTSNGN